jgi:bleomycin hydrolase
MKWFNFTSVSLFFGGCFFAPTQAQFNTNKEGSSYSFEKISHVENTKVKDQCKTATCWSYSTLSLIESDLIRKNKGNHDLSEMYIARCAYVEKAITYVRMNGKHQFDEGGEGHDINYIISKYGIVPEEFYTIVWACEFHIIFRSMLFAIPAFSEIVDYLTGSFLE